MVVCMSETQALCKSELKQRLHCLSLQVLLQAGGGSGESGTVFCTCGSELLRVLRRT